MRARVVALLAAVALVVTACGTGSEEAAGDGGIGSGIGVHGAWSIDVYDADGSLAQSAAFDNALTTTGAKLLDDVLSRASSMGAWSVDLFGTPVGPCTNDANASTWCVIREPGYPHTADSATFDTLTLDPDTDGQVVLSGSATVANDAEITQVSTRFEVCSDTATPAACGSDTVSGGNNLFTQVGVGILDWDNDGTANDGPIPVTAGQTIQVTVEISFGTLP